nr:hypothetical protein [Rhodopirellula sp. SM50]
MNAGLDLQESGRLDEALAKFIEAQSLDFPHSAAAVNAGLIYKQRRQWSKMHECFLFASKHLHGLVSWKRDSILWNLGLSSTALGKWTIASRMWHQIGLPISVSSDEPQLSFGDAIIESVDRKRFSVVTIDPCRGRVQEVADTADDPDLGDLVLHDVSPFEYESVGDGQRPVFELLAVLNHSRLPAYTVEVVAQSADEIAAVDSRLAKINAASNLGRVQRRQDGLRVGRVVGPQLQTLIDVMSAWELERPGRQVNSIAVEEK